jgi:hypothetical protein
MGHYTGCYLRSSGPLFTRYLRLAALFSAHFETSAGHNADDYVKGLSL